MRLQTKKKKKQKLLVFYFAQKRAKKSFLKKCRKSVDKEKKVQYNTKRSEQKKQGTTKYIEK